MLQLRAENQYVSSTVWTATSGISSFNKNGAEDANAAVGIALTIDCSDTVVSKGSEASYVQ